MLSHITNIIFSVAQENNLELVLCASECLVDGVKGKLKSGIL